MAWLKLPKHRKPEQALPAPTQPQIAPLLPIPGFATLQELIIDRLNIRQYQALWYDLQSVRPYWHFVLPLIGWVAWRSYRSEQRVVREEREQARVLAVHKAEREAKVVFVTIAVPRSAPTTHDSKRFHLFGK